MCPGEPAAPSQNDPACDAEVFGERAGMVSDFALGRCIFRRADDERRAAFVGSSASSGPAILAPDRVRDFVAERRQHLIGTIAGVEHDPPFGVVILAEPSRTKVRVVDIDPEVSAVMEE